MFSSRHRTIYNKSGGRDFGIFQASKLFSSQGCTKCGFWVWERGEMKSLDLFEWMRGSNFPSNSVPLPFVFVVLDRIERDVVKSSDQQQWQLRQAHADHEQHRAEEQDQRGPDHHEPERGSANQREYHHDGGIFEMKFAAMTK